MFTARALAVAAASPGPVIVMLRGHPKGYPSVYLATEAWLETRCREKHKRRFDVNYEEPREQTLARQKKMGILPPNLSTCFAAILQPRRYCYQSRPVTRVTEFG
jgi:hypothetical protein